MNVCDRIRPELKAYRDGQLPALSRLAIRWHLAHCADCRREVEEMERISNELREENEPLAPALRARILAALPDGLPDAPEIALRPRWQQMSWIAGGLATATAAVLALLFFLPRMGPLGVTEESGSSASMAGKAVPQASAPMSAGGGAAEGSDRGKSRATENYLEEQKKVSSTLSGPSAASNDEAPVAAPTAIEGQPGGMPGGMANGMSGGARPGMANAPQVPGNFGGVPTGNTGSFGGSRIPGSAGNESDPTRSSFSQKAKNISPPNAVNSRPAVVDTNVVNAVHFDAALTLLVTDVAARSGEIERIATAARGSILTQRAEGMLPTREITLAVPVAEFESVSNRIKRLGEVQAQKVDKKDLAGEIRAQEQAANIYHDGSTKAATNNAPGRAGPSRNAPSKPESNNAKTPADAEKRLRELKKSATQATITVRLTEKPKTTLPAAAPKR